MQPKIIGAVLNREDDIDLPAVVQLLATRLRDQLYYTHHHTARELNRYDLVDFVILNDYTLLENTIQHYNGPEQTPRIIFLTHDDQAIERVQGQYRDYAIVSIRQATLDMPDTTLQFDFFERIINAIRSPLL